MIDCDDTNWPLAITVAEETVTLADHRLFLEKWKGWLDRGRPFVLLRVFVSDAAVIQPDGALSESARWLKENVGRVRALVLAIATTVPRDHLEAQRQLNIDRLFGVPSRVFADGMSAVSWLEKDILWPNGMSIEGL